MISSGRLWNRLWLTSQINMSGLHNLEFSCCEHRATWRKKQSYYEERRLVQEVRFCQKNTHRDNWTDRILWTDRTMDKPDYGHTGLCRQTGLCGPILEQLDWLVSDFWRFSVFRHFSSTSKRIFHQSLINIHTHIWFLHLCVVPLLPMSNTSHHYGNHNYLHGNLDNQRDTPDFKHENCFSVIQKATNPPA